MSSTRTTQPIPSVNLVCKYIQGNLTHVCKSEISHFSGKTNVSAPIEQHKYLILLTQFWEIPASYLKDHDVEGADSASDQVLRWEGRDAHAT